MDAELSDLDIAIEELKIAKEAIEKHKDRPNIAHLRKAYESTNKIRHLLGKSIKEFQSC